MRALSIASTGMLAQQTNVEVIANNLANMNTTGFKEQRAEFTDLLYQNVQTPGAQTSEQSTYAPAGIQIGAGVKTGATYRITTQGDLTSTSNPYDVAIQGSGYFRVQQTDGTDAYTRAGNFALSPQGQIVTQDGMVVQPGIAIPANTTSVTIHNAQGQVNATVAGNAATPQTVGQFEHKSLFPDEERASMPSAATSFLKHPTGLPLDPQAGVPGSPGFGTASSRASWKPPTSIRWTRSRP